MSLEANSELARARHARDTADWATATRCFRELANQHPQYAEFWHNLGLCEFAAGHASRAAEAARQALILDSQLWQAAMVLAKSLVSMGKPEEAAEALEIARKNHPCQPDLIQALGDITLNSLGDPWRALALAVENLQTDTARGRTPEALAEARLSLIVASIYEGAGDAGTISDAVREFAGSQWPAQPLQAGFSSRKKVSSRPRLGLISPVFSASPVYFLTIGALRELADRWDLLVFHRGSYRDWATESFASIASAWFDVPHLGAEALAQVMAKQSPDILIDLGGWMDPLALRALSQRPAGRLFTWVGGQSVTTGTDFFDGFISDRWQSPLSLQKLYSEPLALLPGGYVTYTPPDWMPDPRPSEQASHDFGVIGNPAKFSLGFYRRLGEQIGRYQPESLVFVERRFRSTALQSLVRERLRRHCPGSLPRLEFIVPQSHRDYLDAVNRVHTVVDTWPYSGGLTTMEALYLNRRILFGIGELCCSRHTLAHVQYWNPEPVDHIVAEVAGTDWVFCPDGQRKVMRLDHERIGKDLATLLTG